MRARAFPTAARALGVALWFATAAAAAAAPQLDPRLEQAIAQAGPEDWLRIGVTLEREGLPGLTRLPERAAAIEARQARVLAALPSAAFRIGRRFQTVAGFAGAAQPAAIEALLQRDDVRSVYLEVMLWPALAQGAPLVGADVARHFQLTGNDVGVAVLDSGIDTDHPDLVDDLLVEQCFCSDPHPSPQIGAPCCPGGGETESGPGAAEDDTGHGTNVAGIVSSGGVLAALGVAPDAGIAAVRVGGSSGTLPSDVDAGLEWVLLNRDAFEDPLRVVNLSLSDGGQYASSGGSPCGTSNTADLIAQLAEVGVATFAASGNDGHDGGISYPACVAEAISVGGVYDAEFAIVTWCSASGCSPGLCTDTNVGPDDFVCHTNSGALLDILAPDYRTATPGIGGVQMFFGGTSAASAYAAGEAALLFQWDPELTPAGLRSLLVASGPSVVNPDNALAFPRSDVGDVLGYDIPALSASLRIGLAIALGLLGLAGVRRCRG